ncbi:hypothetical protein V8C35DRAFT_247783 [Trichoderma chlorosporum]
MFVTWFISRWSRLHSFGYIWVPKYYGVIILDQMTVLLGTLAGTVACVMKLGFQSFGFGSWVFLWLGLVLRQSMNDYAILCFTLLSW